VGEGAFGLGLFLVWGAFGLGLVLVWGVFGLGGMWFGGRLRCCPAREGVGRAPCNVIGVGKLLVPVLPFPSPAHPINPSLKPHPAPRPNNAHADIPLKKAIAGVRVALLGEGLWVVNPTAVQMAGSRLDLMMAGTRDAVLMIEGFCDFLSEEEMIEAVGIGAAAIGAMCEQMEAWAAKVGLGGRGCVWGGGLGGGGGAAGELGWRRARSLQACADRNQKRNAISSRPQTTTTTTANRLASPSAPTACCCQRGLRRGWWS